jgi:putative transposase
MKENYQVDLSYKQEVVEFVERQKSLGVSRSKVLVDLAISSSTYYSWKKLIEQGPKEKKIPKPHPAKLTPSEKQLIVATKRENPDKRHRQIQGLIQSCGTYISPSSVFKVLKSEGLARPFERRESPWKEPRYEIRARNLVWGTDWTKLKINHETWQLLTLIDFFSRKIIAWDIQPQINSGHIKAIYKEGLEIEEIDGPKPKLRADQGSPNKSWVTKEFLATLSAELSLARLRRPTDNAITERFYGTIKQEEIYIVGSYPDHQSAMEEIGNYIDYYNEERPHQAIWNFSPSYVHEAKNKSAVLAELEAMKFQTKSRRREYWNMKEMIDMQTKLRESLTVRASGNITLT